MMPDVTTLHVVPLCPACAHRETLVMLGDRLDRLHPWLVWRTRRTFIYLCLHCEAIVALEEPQAGASSAGPPRYRNGRGVVGRDAVGCVTHCTPVKASYVITGAFAVT